GGLPPRAAYLRRRRRILFRPRPCDGVRPVHLYTHSDSRYGGGFLAGAWLCFFFSQPIGGKAFALGVLWLCCSHGPAYSDQGSDWTDLPHWNYRYVSLAHGKPAPSAQAAAVLQLHSFPGHCCALASGRRSSQSCTGTGKRLLLVLLC